MEQRASGRGIGRYDDAVGETQLGGIVAGGLGAGRGCSGEGSERGCLVTAAADLVVFLVMAGGRDAIVAPLAVLVMVED